MSSHRGNPALLLGTGALLLTALALANCTRTPMFHGNNLGALPGTGQPQNNPSTTNPANTAGNPPATNLSTNSSAGGTAPALSAAQLMQGELAGTWTSTCTSPGSYDPLLAKLGSTKNIKVTYAFGTDGSYLETVNAYGDADGNCQSTPTSVLAAVNGTFTVVLSSSVPNNTVTNGLVIVLTPKTGAPEYAWITLDPNLELSTPLETDPTQIHEGAPNITFVRSPSTSASSS